MLAVPDNFRLLGAIFLAINAPLTWRMWRAGVRPTHTGIEVGFFLFSKRWTWDELDRFEVARAGRYPYVCEIVLRNGRRVPVMALSSAARSLRRSGPSGAEVEGAVSTLNALLEQQRVGHRDGGSTGSST